MSVTVRDACISDFDEILVLLQSIAKLHCNSRSDIFSCGSAKYSLSDFKGMIGDANKPVFVAVDEENRILGHVFCQIIDYNNHSAFNDFKSLHIDDLCVNESYRGMGIGKILFEKAKSYARKIGCYNVDLNVWEFNQSAISFYEACGMKTQRRTMEAIL